ncbi:hypothetical protein [Demequina flava]|uniref:hypothetical protein n=1 Tax=Demequina flava TaxID=1095025 RepID=UPI0007866959|nr:hypothetical protein [Demequina flava]
MKLRTRAAALACAAALALVGLAAPAAHAGNDQSDEDTTQWVTWEIPAPGCPTFDAAEGTDVWTSPTATPWVNYDAYGSPACADDHETAMWPQALVGEGTHTQVGTLTQCTWYQVDKYEGRASDINAVLADDTLTHGEDGGITTAWYFHYTGGPTCGTATEEPAEVELTLTYIPACEPDSSNTWVVANASDQDVPFVLKYQDGDEWNTVGEDTAPAGDQAEIKTPREDVDAKITWGDDESLERGEAKASSGEDLDGDNCLETVVAPTPTWAEGCLAGDGAWQFDANAEGIDWAQSAVFGGAYTIEVAPQEGFTFPADAVTSWTAYDTEQTCVVTPPAPTFEDPCGPDNIAVQAPVFPGVEWSTNVVDGVATATATPADGYEFAEEVQSEWTQTDTGEDCPTRIFEEASLDGTLIGNLCLGDVPYFTYDVTVNDPNGLVDDSALPSITFLPDADEEFYPDGVTPIEPLTIDLPTMAGELLWPGASLDSESNPAGWPGWALIGDEWTAVADDNWGWTRDGDVLIEVNPEITVTAAYPEATADCANAPEADDEVVTASRVLSAGPVVVTGAAPAAVPVRGEVTYTG